jgi:hypothetical protein
MHHRQNPLESSHTCVAFRKLTAPVVEVRYPALCIQLGLITSYNVARMIVCLFQNRWRYTVHTISHSVGLDYVTLVTKSVVTRWRLLVSEYRIATDLIMLGFKWSVCAPLPLCSPQIPHDLIFFFVIPFYLQSVFSTFSKLCKKKPALFGIHLTTNDLTWAQNRAAAVGNRRLTAWATARPNLGVLVTA